MTGAGNDFVVIDNRNNEFSLTKEQIAKLCDRRFGIGADGLLAVELSDTVMADYVMRYYNSDGGEAEMCGNGARCFAKFVQLFPRCDDKQVSFVTLAGTVNARFTGTDVEIDMPEPLDWKLNQKADFGWGMIEYHFVNTGVPHVVIFTDTLETEPVVEHGRVIRHSKLFVKGTNVNFVHVADPKHLQVRTYERGVEDETLACGTGVSASALIANKVKGLRLPLRCRVRSGQQLVINADATLKKVTMAGPAVVVFRGEIEIKPH